METAVYVDVLLVLNYVINLLLILCTGKLSGRKTKRRRIVAAALFGSASSLTIFLPFLGFFSSISTKLVISAVIVLLAFSYGGIRQYAKELFLFFAVSFFFAGVMLAIWMFLEPRGMIYYNGIVYFDISSISLIVTTAIAYGILSLGHRFARKGRIGGDYYQVTVEYGGRQVKLTGLVDTGNHLSEPFSGIPVAVAGLDDLEPLFPPEACAALRKGTYDQLDGLGLPVRLIPCKNVGQSGLLPAIRPDAMRLHRQSYSVSVERVYLAIGNKRIGDGTYNLLLHPDFAGVSHSSIKV